jgi:Flp pilus assembly protein TadG
MAIVLPVLSLMIVGAFYAGWVIYTTNMLFHAVEQAARCASVNTATCGGANLAAQVANVQAYAVTQAWGVPVAAANFTVTQQPCGWQVQANYPFLFVMPFQTNFNVTIAPQACFPDM